MYYHTLYSSTNAICTCDIFFFGGGGAWGLTSNDPGNENFNCYPCVVTSSFPKRKKFAFFGRDIRGLLTVHVNVITFESL